MTGGRVLVVDDTAFNRRLLVRLLGVESATTRPRRSTGGQALQVAARPRRHDPGRR